MNSTSWKICVTGRYNDEATAELESGPHQITYDKTQLPDCDIAFGQPDPQVVIESNLRWVHLSSAGYTNYDNDAVREALHKRGAILTNSSSVYDEPCAQHALAMMLAFARRLPQIEKERGHWNSGPHRTQSFLLSEQTVLFLGYGAIARRMEELLKPFRPKLFALRRHKQGNESTKIIGLGELDSVLNQADHIVNLLPESPSTRGFMNRHRFAQMRPGALYYNIGRGATTDQEALLKNLHSGHLGGAYLDVTSPEPLPFKHPLWSAPNCFITPHSAGGHANEDWRLVMHFLGNLSNFNKGEQLNDVVFA
jgi:phosphoglycerate dehydrogenase-like enzyme